MSVPAESLAFVQFIHPGKEHGPGSSSEHRAWNMGPHRRKFMLTNGAYVIDGRPREARVAFWGEWEPPSRVVREYATEGDLPRFVHEPLIEHPESYQGRQNTDPYVFGSWFIYTGCQQHTNKGETETQLRRLKRGSVILFGSCLARSRFVIDTVFVVADFFDHCSGDYRSVLRDAVTDPYWTVTLGPWYQDSKAAGTRSFRLYRGATPEHPIDGMFSFAPCLPDKGSDPRFERPEVQLPHVITPHLTQGKRVTKLSRVEEAVSLWNGVVKQVARRGLALGVRFDAPA